MSKALHLTTDWPLERLMPYSPQITACLRKLRDKYPEDGTMDSYAQDIMSGAVQLWLALEEDDFRGIVLTTIKVIEATGFRSLVIADAAGDEGLDFVPFISTIEDWGREQGLENICAVGRVGWKKPLEKQGYKIDRIVYRKAL